MATPTRTSMTINVPVEHARGFFATSFSESAEATFATAPGMRIRLHSYDGYIPTMKSGDVLGHEFMSRIVEVGPIRNSHCVLTRCIVSVPVMTLALAA